MKKIKSALYLVLSFCAGMLTVFLLSNIEGEPKTAAGQVAPQLVVYTGENFTGRSLVIQDSVLDFPLVEDPDGSFFDWNDKVRSMIVVSGTWRCYENGRLNTRLDDTELELVDVRTKQADPGWSALVSASPQGEVRIASLAEGGLGEDISSIELISAEPLADWSGSFRHP